MPEKKVVLFLDETMPMSPDMFNSFIWDLKTNIKIIQESPETAGKMWHALFGAYMPSIDYKNMPGLVPVVELAKKWIEEYPTRIKISGGKGNSRKILELDSHFLTQFMIIRRALYLQNMSIRESTEKIIDLDELLNKLGCSLDDMLLTYNIYHNQVATLSRTEIARCDKIIQGMSFDKDWSSYFNNSRSKCPKLTFWDEHTINEAADYRPNGYECIVPFGGVDGEIAFKEMRVYKENICDEPMYFNLKYNTPQYKGWLMRVPIPEKGLWNQIAKF